MQLNGSFLILFIYLQEIHNREFLLNLFIYIRVSFGSNCCLDLHGFASITLRVTNYPIDSNYSTIFQATANSIRCLSRTLLFISDISEINQFSDFF